MGVIAVNWSEAGLTNGATLASALDAVPRGGRVTVMIHGFRFDPNIASRSPHNHIFSLRPNPDCWKAISWSRHLHMDRDTSHLGIGFGWPAVDRLTDVAERAFLAGVGLADMIAGIVSARPDLRVGMIAHSLGARVALSALAHAPADSVQRCLLLSGAEYRDVARMAMASPAGRRVRVHNIRSFENALFDIAFRLAIPARHFGSLPLGAGLPGLPNWTDLRIDCPATRNGLAALGHQIPPPHRRVCHWSVYLRPGLFALYRRLLDPDDMVCLRNLTATGHKSNLQGRGEELRPLSPL